MKVDKMDTNDTYHAVSVTADEANRKRAKELAIKHSVARCFICARSGRHNAPCSSDLAIEAEYGDCSSFEADDPCLIISILERYEAEEQRRVREKLQCEREERKKRMAELRKLVVAKRRFLYRIAHEVKKIMSRQPLPPIPVNIPDSQIDERV